MKTKSANSPLIVEPALVIKNQAGERFFSFPIEVVSSMRQLINHVTKQNARRQADRQAASLPESQANSLPGVVEAAFPSRVSVISALRGEGVTYTAWALAAVLVNDYSARVCVVDLNWWNPLNALPIPSQNGGLAEVLTQELPLEKAILHTGQPNLDFLPAGALSKEDRSLYARGPVLRKLMNTLAETYDHLILDIPAIHLTHDAVPLAQIGKNCCLVVRQGVTTVEDAQTALSEVDHLDMLGVVLNQVKSDSPTWFRRLFPIA